MLNIRVLKKSLVLVLLFSGCSKESRLSVSTLVLFISPNSASVNAGKTQKFTASGRSAKSDNVDVSPSWSVEPTNLGTVSPSKGKSTTFTAGSSAGSGKIKAIEGDVIAEALISVVAGGGGGGGGLTLNVYNDAGISGNDVWTWSDGGIGSFNAKYVDASAPEGTESFETKTNTGNWAGWGVVYTTTPKDLSAYSGGSLKFYVKSAATIKIEIQDGNNKYTRYTNQYGYGNTNTWSELTIPLADFGSVSLNNIKLPFMATIESSGNFYIDDVRWIK